MGLFDTPDVKALQAQVKDLQQQVSDIDDDRSGLTQQVSTLQSRLDQLTKAATKDGARALAMDVGTQAANLRWGTYGSWEQYRDKVVAQVYRAIIKATTGQEPDGDYWPN